MQFRHLSLFFVSLFLITSCGCGSVSSITASAAKSDNPNAPKRYSYKVINTYPHSVESYTQGLYWSDGFLWESTGEFGNSAFQKVELESGKIVERIPLDYKYFGEGAALLNGKIYQLTWTNQTAFVYDAATLELLNEVNYQGEGWGITTDGEKLYMSNGTHHLYVVEPDGFEREKTLTVTMNGRPLREVNELEWIEGKIWANIFMSDLIVIINPESGNVEGMVDFGGILPESERHPNTDVFNGIAYDAELKRIFVTGKNWSQLFEIEIVELDE